MNGNEEKMNKLSEMADKAKNSQKETLGVINHEFLMQSIGAMLRKEPVCLDQDSSVALAVNKILELKSGSALLVNEKKQVVGIFTERDYLKNFAKGDRLAEKTSLKEVSTLNPVLVTPETTLAHALNLMSLGGFRHLPVVDQDGMALGVLSVRDVIDKISDSLVNDLLSFEL